MKKTKETQSNEVTETSAVDTKSILQNMLNEAEALLKNNDLGGTESKLLELANCGHNDISWVGVNKLAVHYWNTQQIDKAINVAVQLKNSMPLASADIYVIIGYNQLFGGEIFSAIANLSIAKMLMESNFPAHFKFMDIVKTLDNLRAKPQSIVSQANNS